MTTREAAGRVKVAGVAARAVVGRAAVRAGATARAAIVEAVGGGSENKAATN